MKCDDLKPIKQGSVEIGEYWVYDAEEVDAAIAELKTKNERLKKCEIGMFWSVRFLGVTIAKKFNLVDYKFVKCTHNHCCNMDCFNMSV